MALLPGVFAAKKKNGSVYYRSSVTFRSKHISLGSYSAEEEAHQAYTAARGLLAEDRMLTPEDYEPQALPFLKWVVLTNFKNNGIYIKTPIYLRSNYFHYYLSQTDVLLFDVDDLFYYSHHSIMRRGNHLFVADYGMQVNIASRYGIKNFAVKDRDFRYVNGDDHDLRYANIEIINPYYGVSQLTDTYAPLFQTKIHVNGDWIVGQYSTAEEAAIAYNKAVDLLAAHGFEKNYTKNYLSDLSGNQYKEIYHQLEPDPRFLTHLEELADSGEGSE